MSYRNYRGRRVAACLVLSAVAGLAVASDGTNQNGVLRLRTGDVVTAAGTNFLALPAVPKSLTERVAVVQLTGPITREQRAALEGAGVVLYDYLPDFAYAADLGNADMAALGAMPFVRWVGAFEDAWKVSPALGHQTLSSPERVALAGGGRYSVHVVLWPGADLGRAEAALGRVPGVEIESHGWTGREMTVVATMPLAAAGAVAAIGGVRWIEDSPEIDLRNATVRWIVQSNVTNDTPIYDHGITGVGQVLGLMDGRPDRNHCSLNDPEGDPPGPDHRKILAYNTSFGSDFHGTHVAGTAIGDAGNNTDTRGVAYGAKLVFDDTASASGFLANLNHHYSQGATVHSNSWGNDGTVAYDALARVIDVFSWDNDDNLVCFAVTNTGSLKNPENAKDVLAVGATSDSPNQANHCYGGTGPTNDERRKPEIYAPGCNIRSATAGSECGTRLDSGTSMACPAIAGAALLVRQYFTSGFYPTGAAVPEDGFTPTGMLLKATLLNATTDMTGVSGYPSDREGWGRVLLHNSLVFEDDVREMIVHDVRIGGTDAMTTGDYYEVVFEVNSIFEPLKATLAWHEPPGNLNANPAYVNDLNLTVIGPTGTFLGNVFSGGVSTTGGTADFRNNVEMVLMPVPAPGTYTLRVDAAAVNVGEQGYAVVVTGDVSEVVDSPCVADWNGDGVPNFFDVQEFLADFAAMDPATDLADDGVLNFFDVQAFLAEFAAGCP